MDQTAPASELERRKLLRIRLRRDLNIEPSKYEGKTYYVVKDPVSLRYYRLKDNEHYLLQFMDGKRTLEDAQKSYEKQYRPDRLKLEDLEGFAQQLLTAGLAQNDSPRAGKQLYDRRKKRKRSEWIQTFTNILYIKIPIFDPDRILTRMLRYLGWIFSLWFFALSVGVMLGAILLVATHFESFWSKLPNVQEFFRFKTLVYFWAVLIPVKIIHEFGHGLSCKRFGGEVHEMGALFLCLSPALYCNVSDAWILPNKWHRIIISAAGIYVELLIAAIATFFWWNAPTETFWNTIAFSLMTLCSVSTVLFNGNPLMRYDGYYVLADLLEIPNLRERSNRFLKNLTLEHCLGVEVQPEAYMALWRKILFVTYAIVSYVYRWVITFAILYMMDNFLKPYKLQVVSHMLAFAAAASMVGWPLYRLGKNIHRRGRLPDMKRWRVILSSSVLILLILFVCLVPVPVSRVRGIGLVQPLPDATAKVFIRRPGILEKLRVSGGDHVRKGDRLAEFSDRDLEADLEAARAEQDGYKQQLRLLKNSKDTFVTTDTGERARLDVDISETDGKLSEITVKVETLQKIKDQELVLYAPCDGVIGQAPVVDDIGKSFEKDPNKPFCTINEPRRVRVCLPVETPEYNLIRENLEHDSSAAQTTRRLLHKRVTVDYKTTRLADVVADLNGQVKGLHLGLNTEPGLAEDLPITFQAEKQRLDRVLDKICDRFGLGYVVISDERSDRDGWVQVRASHERGYPEGLRQLAELDVTLRVHGRDSHTWKGKIRHLPESEAKEIPPALSSKANGPIAVKAQPGKNATLIPQAQHYLVYVDILDPDDAIVPGQMAQVKVHCRPETCIRWLWRKLNNTFKLGLI